jgi:hypothetical protein
VSDEATALKGGEAVPVGDWSEAETLERIGSEVATNFIGSGEGIPQRLLVFSGRP